MIFHSDKHFGSTPLRTAQRSNFGYGRSYGSGRDELPDAVAVGLFLIPVPYILIAVVGVVRSANRYDGPPVWATLARVAVLAWGALMIFI